jgi:uncharacterized protein with FMN-binding domain
MGRIATWLLATACGLVLLFSYHTSTMGPGAPVRAAGVVALPSAPAATPSSGAGRPTTSTTGTDTVVTGPAVETRRGPVQVQVRVANGRLADVVTLALPDSNFRDERINAYAVPILRQEALDAQSAKIDSVSGATVTSDGYVASLQAALDSIRLGKS